MNTPSFHEAWNRRQLQSHNNTDKQVLLTGDEFAADVETAGDAPGRGPQEPQPARETSSDEL